MVIIKRKSVQEKVTNFTKVIESETTKATIDALRNLVKRNQNMKPYHDAGGQPAAILAYIVGVAEGIDSYIAFSSGLTGAELQSLRKAHSHLIQAKAEAFTALREPIRFFV